MAKRTTLGGKRRVQEPREWSRRTLRSRRCTNCGAGLDVVKAQGCQAVIVDARCLCEWPEKLGADK